MKYKKIQSTQHQISAIGFGCMGIGGYLSKDADNDDEYIKAIQYGIECGITFIDTAECYGAGYSEEIVGRAIKNIRDKIFIATKISPENLAYDNVIKSAENSLKRLKTDYIDLYQIHWPNPKISISETINAFEKLITDGKIKYIGVSNFSLKELNEAENILQNNSIVSIQLEYNLFDRMIEKNILPYCEQKNILTIAYSPLDQGRIACGDEKIKKLMKIAEKNNKTIAQIVLNWLISHKTVIAIPKALSLIHIKENAQATDFTLSENDLNELSDIFKNEIAYIPTEKICVVENGQGNRKVYKTVEEAIENRLEFVPSPVELANEIRNGEDLKPIRLIHTKEKNEKYDYNLIEGRIRYWAWVIAFNGNKPIPAYIRYN